MKCFSIDFEHEGQAYSCIVDKFDDKKEPVYLIHLPASSLVNKCNASMITLCNSLAQTYYTEHSALAPLVISIWNAIKQKEKYLNENWLRLPSWLKAVKKSSLFA